MNGTSRYEGLGVVTPGELNSRPEYALRALVDGDALERGGLTREYQVTQGERLDIIAYHELGDSRLWWLIADLNPSVDPLLLAGGEILRLPRMEALA